MVGRMDVHGTMRAACCALRDRALIVAGVVSLAWPVGGAAQQGQTHTAARAAFEARRYDEAESGFAALARANPDDPAANHHLARLALRRGDDATAARLLERAVKAEPGVAEHHRWLGRAYAQAALHASLLRRASLAGRIRSAFERAVELDPRSVDARMDLLRFYVAAPGIAGGSVRRAREQAEAIARLDAVPGHIARGIVAEKENDDARAEREYRTALAIDEASAAPLYALGALYQRAGRHAEAFAVYEQLLAAHPAESDVLYQIGRTASNSGERLDEGERALRRYLEIPTVEGTPLPASAHYRLGLIHERQGRLADAAREFEAALRLEKERDEVRAALARVRGAGR